MAQLELGAVVRLKSGGPDMTVDRWAAHVTGVHNGRLICVWFEGTERRSGEFAAEAVDVASRRN